MSTKQIQKSREIVIHDFDKGLEHTVKAIEKLSVKNSEPEYDYAPTRDLNELLKGLTLAN